MKKQFVVLFVFFLVVFRPLYGQVRINEFLIEPAPQTVELMNAGSGSADVSSWYIDDSGGSTYFTIPQETVLYPNACVVFTGDFNLNKNSADTIRLFNTIAPPTSSSAELIDAFSYKSSSGSGVAFFRVPDGNGDWSTGSATLGNYNTANQSCVVTPTVFPTPTLAPTLILKLTPMPTRVIPTPIVEVTPTTIPPPSYNGIFISEAYIYPETGEHEWVEFYNDNWFSVSLQDWLIDDAEAAGSVPKRINLDIPARGYGVFEMGSSIFNNGGDNVRLLDSEKNLRDGFEYNKAIKGKSLARQHFDDDVFCEQTPSKGLPNLFCDGPTPMPRPTQPTAAIRLRGTNVVMKKQSGEEIMGISTEKKNTSKQLIQSLSFASFLSPLLTIVSIFLKIKKSI